VLISAGLSAFTEQTIIEYMVPALRPDKTTEVLAVIPVVPESQSEGAELPD
jgi:hypothetical protein